MTCFLFSFFSLLLEEPDFFCSEHFQVKAVSLDFRFTFFGGMVVDVAIMVKVDGLVKLNRDVRYFNDHYRFSTTGGKSNCQSSCSFLYGKRRRYFSSFFWTAVILAPFFFAEAMCSQLGGERELQSLSTELLLRHRSENVSSAAQQLQNVPVSGSISWSQPSPGATARELLGELVPLSGGTMPLSIGSIEAETVGTSALKQALSVEVRTIGCCVLH